MTYLDPEEVRHLVDVVNNRRRTTKERLGAASKLSLLAREFCRTLLQEMARGVLG